MIHQARHLHLLVRLAVLCAAGLIFALGVISYQTRDRDVPPGTTSTIHVQQVATSEAAAVSALETAAADAGVNLIRLGANPDGPSSAPWYFTFIGDRAAFDEEFPDGRYPAFAPSSAPELFSSSQLIELNQPIRGTYAVQGSEEGAAAASESLNSAGLTNARASVDTARNYMIGLLASSSWPALIAALLALSLSVVYWVVSSRRATSIQELHGMPRSRVTLNQAGGLALNLIPLTAAVVAAGIVFLYYYNGLAQISHFWPWVLTPMVILIVLTLAVQLVASVSVLRLDIYRAIKGARPVRLLAASAVLSQFVMVALVFFSLLQSAGSIATITSDSRTFAYWERGSGVTVQVNPNAMERPGDDEVASDVVQAHADFATIFHELEADGSAVLSFHRSDEETGTSDAEIASYGPLRGNSMVVNNTYLDNNQVLAANGTRVTDIPPAPGKLTLLVPEALEGEAAVIADDWANNSLAGSDPFSDERARESFTVEVLLTRDGQEVFNYGDTWRMERWTQSDPVIAVVSEQTEYFSDYNLLRVAANTGNVVFSDPDRFREMVEEFDLGQRFSSISDPAALAAEQLRERTTQLLISGATALVGLVVIIGAVGLLAALYTNAVQLSSFVRRLHGHPAGRIHWRFVVGMTTLTVAATALAALLLEPAGLAGRSLSIVLAVGVVSVVVAVLLIAVGIFDSRMRATLIKQR